MGASFSSSHFAVGSMRQHCKCVLVSSRKGLELMFSACAVAGVQVATGQDGLQQLNRQTMDCAESPTDGVFTWGRIFSKEFDKADSIGTLWKTWTL